MPRKAAKPANRKEMDAKWAKRQQEPVEKPVTEPAEQKPSKLLKDVARVHEYLSEAYLVLSAARDKNPHMIEAVQAADALREALAKTGQVQGLLEAR